MSIVPYWDNTVNTGTKNNVLNGLVEVLLALPTLEVLSRTRRMPMRRLCECRVYGLRFPEVGAAGEG